jgi:hypothetical protein
VRNRKSENRLKSTWTVTALIGTRPVVNRDSPGRCQESWFYETLLLLTSRKAVRILLALIGFAGYVLPIPCLIWGWVRWLSSKPHFAAPTWRSILAFSGLALSSVVGLSVFLVVAQANGMPEGTTKYSFALASSRVGFTTSVLSLLLALVGKGPVRLPAALASF